MLWNFKLKNITKKNSIQKFSLVFLNYNLQKSYNNLILIKFKILFGFLLNLTLFILLIVLLLIFHALIIKIYSYVHLIMLNKFKLECNKEINSQNEKKNPNSRTFTFFIFKTKTSYALFEFNNLKSSKIISCCYIPCKENI